MEKYKHTIFGFIGPSGSGKSTLIVELSKLFPHLQIIKSTSTRPYRGPEDDLFYDLISDEEFVHRMEIGEFINFHKYNEYWYGTDMKTTQAVLDTHCGFFSLVENAVPEFQAKGMPLTLIKVIPGPDVQLVRPERKEWDEIRATIPLQYDLEVTNTFKPGGLEDSVKILSDFISKSIASHI